MPANDGVNFRMTLLNASADLFDDNVDAEVELADGRKFSCTFFTLFNIRSLMSIYKTSGECCNGRYFWALDMILVEDLRLQTLEATIADMIVRGDLEQALSVISD